MTMQPHAHRLRIAVASAVLLVGLFGGGAVAAAEATSSSPPPPTVAGRGILSAEGDGTARLAGGYVLAGSLDGGTLAIRGLDRWSRVRVTGWTSKTRLDDGTIEYRFGDATGKFWIAGRTLVTTIESDAIRFRAVGHGRATLVGAGSYWVNGRGPLPWTDPGAEAAF
jgi:hypothetical protein